MGEALLVDVVDVVPEGEGRPHLPRLPGRAERGRPGVAAVEAPGLVGPLEGAVPEPAQEHVLAVPEDGQVEDAVRIDVERVRAGDRVEVGLRARDALEPQRSAGRTSIAEQGRGSRTAREIEVR